MRGSIMRIKRFKARDTKTALQMVKEELGPEAVILSTRELSDPLGGKGTSVEITAGIGYHPQISIRTTPCSRKKAACQRRPGPYVGPTDPIITAPGKRDG